MANARMTAVMGSCPRSKDSFNAGRWPLASHVLVFECIVVSPGVRNYMKFATQAFGDVSLGFPPTLDSILAWSSIFRNVGTFSNYVGYVNGACLALDVPCPSTCDPAIRRSKMTIVKKMVESSSRPRHFIQRAMVKQLVATASESHVAQLYAMLWRASYVFLLRVPSEALMMRRGGENVTTGPNEWQKSVLFFDESTSELCLKLHRRKNKERGSVLKRVCSCSSGTPELCPVHVLWEKFFKSMEPGTAPWWMGINAGEARTQLRNSLQAMQVILHSYVEAIVSLHFE